MYLFIDTSDQSSHSISLISEIGVPEQETRVEADLEVSLLPAIDKILAEKGVPLTAIQGIIVITGPGGFTSLRIGLSVANALGWALGIPVVGARSEETIQQVLGKLNHVKEFMPVLPTYGRELNITKAKQ